MSQADNVTSRDIGDMKKPVCRLCGVAHYTHERHVLKDSGAASDEKRGATVDRSSRDATPPPVQGKGVKAAANSGEIPSPVNCIHCGADAELFEDAAKWRRQREKRREHMRRRRKGV